MNVWKGYKYINNVNSPSDTSRVRANLISKIFFDRKTSNTSCLSENMCEFISPTTSLESDIQNFKTSNQIDHTDKKIKDEVSSLVLLNRRNDDYFENAKKKQINSSFSPKNYPTFKNIMTNKIFQEVTTPTKLKDCKLPSLKSSLMHAKREDMASERIFNEYSAENIEDFSFAITPKIQNPKINSERLVKSRSNSSHSIKLLDNKLSRNFIEVIKDSKTTVTSPKNDEHALLRVQTSNSKTELKTKFFKFTRKKIETNKNEKHPTDSFFICSNYQI